MGGLALFAIMKMLWIMLAGVQAANFFFLFIILLGSFAGVFLGMDIRDPVRSGSARSPPPTHCSSTTAPYCAHLGDVHAGYLPSISLVALKAQSAHKANSD